MDAGADQSPRQAGLLARMAIQQSDAHPEIGREKFLCGMTVIKLNAVNSVGCDFSVLWHALCERVCDPAGD